MDDYQATDLQRLRDDTKQKATRWLWGYTPIMPKPSDYIFDVMTTKDEIYEAVKNGIQDAIEEDDIDSERIADRLYFLLFQQFAFAEYNEEKRHG